MPGIADQLDKWTSVHKLRAEPPRERMTSEQAKPRVERRMAQIDSLTPDQRAVVHEYGWNLVDILIRHGVTKPKHMRAIINAVTQAAVDRCYREPKP